MNFLFYLPFTLIIPTLINFSLGIYVIKKTPRNETNRWFSYFIFLVCLWTFSNFIFYGPIRTFFCGKLMYAVGALIVPTAIVWILFLRRRRPSLFKKIFIFFPFIILAVLSLIDRLIVVKYEYDKFPWPSLFETGPLFWIFSIILSLGIFYAILEIFLELKVSEGIRKKQIQYIFTGLLLMGFIPVCSSLLPPLFGKENLAFIDSYSSFFWTSLCVYAITRYRFMDIKVVIKKTVIYCLSFSLLILIVASLILGANKYLLQNYNLVNVIIVEVILIVIFLPQLKKIILGGINKYIQKDEIDLSKNIEEFNREISYSNYLDDLMNKSVGFIKKEFLIEKVDFIVRDFTKPELGYFFPLANTKILDERTQDFLVNYFNSNKEILFKQELPFIKADKKDNKDLQEISRFLRKEGYEAIIAFKHWEVINGFLCIGSKNNGDVFSQEDAKLLESLANQVNIALFRVLSYEEAVGRVKREFGSSKQEINN